MEEDQTRFTYHDIININFCITLLSNKVHTTAFQCIRPSIGNEQFVQ